MYSSLPASQYMVLMEGTTAPRYRGPVPAVDLSHVGLCSDSRENNVQ